MVYKLYAAPLSLYSGKARGYLRWKNIPYVEVPCSVSVYEKELVPRVGYPIVPVIVTPDDKTVQDTTDIIDYLEAHEPGASVYPDTPVQKLAALIFELFGDEYLVIAAMHYRWAYNKDYAWGEFGKALFPELSGEAQLEAGKERAAKFMAFLPMLGITENSVAAIEQGYEKFLRAFNAHLAQHPFLFGTRPSIGDYGLLGPLYAHNYRDPASGEMMEKIAPRVADWCRRTHTPQHPLTGDFLADDAIPETLLPVLELFSSEQLPLLMDTYTHLEAWAKNQYSGTEIPRAIGVHKIKIQGTEADRAVIPYSLWMLQRVSDHLNGLSGADKQAADALLRKIGADSLIGFTPSVRVARKNFKTVLA